MTWSTKLDPSREFATKEEALEYDAQLEVKQFRNLTDARKEFEAKKRSTEGLETSTGTAQLHAVDIPKVPLPDSSQFAKGTALGDTGPGTAIREEIAFEGIGDVAESDEDKKVIKSLVDAGRYDDVVAYVGSIKRQKDAQTLTGGRGAEIKYTIDPKNAEEIEGYVNFLQGKLDEDDAAKEPTLTGETREAIEGIIHTAPRNIFEAGRSYDNLTVSIAKRLAILEKGAPIKLKHAKDVTRGRIEEKTQTEKELKGDIGQTAGEIGATKKGLILGAEIDTKLGRKEDLGEIEAAKAGARTTATVTANLEAKYDLAAKGMYDLGKTEVDAVHKSARMHDSVDELSSYINSGNLNLLDVTKLGEITNPRARQLVKVINEFYARPLSGAAINNSEWVSFRAQLLNKTLMATEEGRKAVLKRFKDLQKDAKIVGGLITKDDNWLNRLKRFEVSGEGETTGQKPDNLTNAEWEELQLLEKKYGK